MNTALQAEAQRLALPEDSANAVQMLTTLFPTGPWCLAGIDPSGNYIQVVTFKGRSQLGAMRQYIGKWNGTRNLHLTVNPVRSAMGKKPSERDIASFHYAHVDCDPLKGETSTDAIARHHKALAEFDPPPTAVWTTGNGVTALWKLLKPIPLNRDDDTIRTMCRNINISLREKLGGKQKAGVDNCQSIDHLLRLAHTVNIPNAKKLKDGRKVERAGNFEFHPERVYSVFDFPGLPAPSIDSIASTPSIAQDYEPEPYESLADLGLDERTIQIIEHGSIEGQIIGDGSRSDSQFYAAVRLVRAGASPGIMYSVLSDAANLISERVYEKGDADKHVRALIKNAFEAEFPKVNPEDDFDEPLDSKWTDADFDANLFEETRKPPAKRRRFRAMSFDELDSLQPPEWLVKNFVAVQSVSLVYGKPKSGKTYCVGTLGLCLATGRPFCGIQVKKSRVLHIVAEGSPAFFANRIRAFVIATAKSDDDKKQLRADLQENWSMVAVPVHLNTPEHVKQFLEDNAQQYDLIIVDTLLRNMTGDVNSSKDMGDFIRGCDKLKDATGAAILIIHHDGKAQERGPLGSTALTADVDMAALVTFDKATNKRKIAIQPNRYGAGLDGDITFTLESIPVGEDEEGNIVSSAAVRFLAREEKQELTMDNVRNVAMCIYNSNAKNFAEIIRKLNIPDSTAYDLFGKMKKEGILENTRKPNLTSDGRKLIEDFFEAD